MRILTQFLCSLASFKLSTLGVRHPSRTPSLLDCFMTRHSRAAWCFCSCELSCHSVVCVLLHYFNAQPYVFGSSAANNFVREGPVNHDISHWRLSISWKLTKLTSKNLRKFVSGGTWSLRPHSGCATDFAFVNWAEVPLSVFYSLVLARCRRFLQLL